MMKELLSKLSEEEKRELAIMLKPYPPKKNGKKKDGKVSDSDLLKAVLAFHWKDGPLPILAHVLIQNGKVSATDLGNGIEVPFPLFKGIETTAPAEFLKKAIKKEDNKVEVKDGYIFINSQQAVTLPSAEYPIHPKPEGQDDFITDIGQFGQALSEVSRFIAKAGESRAVLTGIHIDRDMMIGTDGRRLIKMKVLEDNDKTFTIAPDGIKPLITIAKIFPSLLMKCWKGENRLFFHLVNDVQGFVTIMGEYFNDEYSEPAYPDYNVLYDMAKDRPISVKVNKDEFKQALETALTTAQEMMNPGLTTITVSGNSMLVHSKTADYGETNITLPCVSNGEIKIAFNGKYMLDFVAITKGETFCMDFKTEGENKEPKSIRINEEGHYEGILMPIRIKEEVYS